MKLTVKTLKGGKFEVEVDDSSTVEQVKGVIEQTKSELPASGMKLIHSGKVLKDSDTISTCGIKPNDFLVVMITKAKKPAAAPAAATPTAAVAAATTAGATTAGAAATTTSSSSSEAKTPAPAATGTQDATSSTPAPAVPSDAPEAPQLSSEAIEGLMAMGFPEAEVRHCLRVAQGNPDIAVEFLTNGIPDHISAAAATASSSSIATPTAAPSSSSNSSTSSQPLQSLRNHPQFDALRRLVQSNPAMLQQVLTQIGQQQPELLQEINANQALFLQMMNEPIVASGTSATGTSATTQSTTTSQSRSSTASGGGGGGGGLGSPTQMAQLIQNMSPEEINQMALMMGLSPEQLRQTAQMIGNLPPEQLQHFMLQAMGGGGAGGGDMDDMMMFGGGGGSGGGPQVLHLTEEEMAAVDRLTEMGFDRGEAAQAFLACDKNEAMAANLLMDSMMNDDNFGSGNGGGGSGGGGNNNNGDNDDDDDADDMYD